MPDKHTATFYQEEVYRLARSPRYNKMTVYETLGALEIVKNNLIADLKRHNYEESKEEDEREWGPDGTGPV
jgi:hypothetical protein